ncbi:hypothetical protein [Alcanivorax jadensis]|uniref:hypothetical protein n=1 Tax=Alcanivorax jadensis TaxID=64988 RepID=UPI001188D2B3|nr:hypothetical protein [Alcanivorax jadensis]QDP60297.1 MAG: hypothetical protein Tp1122MES720101_3 [Prokaryotic dsDNA virus sp.]|tara:strand:- start:6163 stop:6855 length:693 start_codon:yes stop_codon:yes gene_type:complete
MSGVATAIAGSAIVGGVVASKSASKQAKAAGQASDAQVQANRENIEFQKEIFEQQREDNAPWREIGAESLKELRAGIDSGEFDMSNFRFKADPGYQFRRQEGINALDASAAARGRLQSGAQARAVTRYGSELASQEYGNAFNRERTIRGDRFNRLATLSNVGQVANSADQQARSNMASNVSASTTATGNALAQGAINKGNARASAYQGIGQSINQGAQNFLLYNALGTGG